MGGAVIVLLAGLLLTGFGYLDSCPGTPAPGWSCYSPPWAIPAYDLGRALLALSLVVSAVLVVTHLRSRRRSR